MAENKNHLGLDKFQVTVIKSNYNSTKPIRKLIEKAQAKLNAANAKYEEAHKALVEKFKSVVDEQTQEINAYNQQIEMLDKFTLETTKNACGLELTSEQVIEYLDNPAAFAAYKQEKLGNDMFEGQPQVEQPKAKETELPLDEPRDLDAEEDKDWEDKIQSGEIKEAV